MADASIAGTTEAIDSEHYAEFVARLRTWLETQPDVVDTDEVASADGTNPAIFGFALVNTSEAIPVSLTINITP